MPRDIIQLLHTLPLNSVVYYYPRWEYSTRPWPSGIFSTEGSNKHTIQPERACNHRFITCINTYKACTEQTELAFCSSNLSLGSEWKKHGRKRATISLWAWLTTLNDRQQTEEYGRASQSHRPVYTENTTARPVLLGLGHDRTNCFTGELDT